MRAESAAPGLAPGATAMGWTIWTAAILRPRSKIANCANRWCRSHFAPRHPGDRLCPACRDWAAHMELLALLTNIAEEARR